MKKTASCSGVCVFALALLAYAAGAKPQVFEFEVPDCPLCDDRALTGEFASPDGFRSHNARAGHVPGK